MKEVIKYQSNDGKLFDSRIDAAKRDSLLFQMDIVNASLPYAVDLHAGFVNGGGYVPHSKTKVDGFIKAVADLIEQFCSKEWADMFRTNPNGIIGRYISDSDSPLWKLVSRVYCLDAQYREWGQPYFALHPNEGKQVVWPNVAC